MNNQWQHAVSKRWFDVVLGCAHHTENDWVDGFEVAWVCRQLDGQLRAMRRNVCAHCTQVILHVARALHRRWVDIALELFKDLVVALAHHIAEHVEAAAVCHAQHCAMHLRIGCARQDGVEDWNGRFGAL